MNILEELPGYVRRSREQCNVTFCEPDNGQYHAQMPCGHVFDPEAVNDMVKSCVNSNKYIFNCPVEGCKKEWPFFVIKHVIKVCVSEREIQAFERKYCEDALMFTQGMRRCPGCQSYCIKSNLRTNRVACTVCKANGNKRGSDFCWVCLHPWGPNGVCINTNCDGVDPKQRILMECPKKTIYGISTKSVRACPFCGILIYHEDKCKHMTCINPEHKFCFICLTKGHGCKLIIPCKPAPVQNIDDLQVVKEYVPPPRTELPRDDRQSGCIIN